MAQHDGIISNDTGANVRADINNALAAVFGTHSGATEPSTTYAYQLWMDTSSNVLKIRNSANSAWYTLPVTVTANNTVDINGGTIDGVTIGGSSAGAITGTTITGTSFVSSGDMTFGDNDKAIFGAGSDLQIYHNGSASFIDEQGTGNLILRGSAGIIFSRYDGTENMLTAYQDDAVTLYYNGLSKLATQSTGVAITGIAETTAGVYWGELYNSTGLTTQTFTTSFSGAKLLWVTFTTTNSTADLIIYANRLYSGAWHCHGWKIAHNAAPATFTDGTTVSDANNTYQLTANGGSNQMIFSRSSGSTNWNIKVKYAGNM